MIHSFKSQTTIISNIIVYIYITNMEKKRQRQIYWSK